MSYLRIQVRPEGQPQTAHREEALLVQHHHQAAGGHVSGHVQGKYLPVTDMNLSLRKRHCRNTFSLIESDFIVFKYVRDTTIQWCFIWQ